MGKPLNTAPKAAADDDKEAKNPGDLGFTVTVRCAQFVPAEVLPHEDKEEGETVGRETWVSAKAVLAFFNLSGRLTPGKPVAFTEVKSVGGKPIQAEKTDRTKGIACTNVSWSSARIWNKKKKASVRATGDPSASKEVGMARIPLSGLTAGEYILQVVPPEKPENQRTAAKDPKKINDPAGPSITVAKGDTPLRTYRPLFVKITFDDAMKIRRAETCRVDQHGHVSANAARRDASGKLVELAVNHGYVTAFADSELAIDLKPDYVRSPRAHAGGRSLGRGIHMVVIHCTGGPIMGNALNMMAKAKPKKKPADVKAKKSAAASAAPAPAPAEDDKKKKKKEKDEGAAVGPHYEIDLDGHVVKFAEDSDVTWHAGPSTYFYAHETNSFTEKVNFESIGIEVTNHEGLPTAHGKTQAPVHEQQICALVRLLKELQQAHSILPHHIVGHGDIKTNSDEWIAKENERRALVRYFCPAHKKEPRKEAPGKCAVCGKDLKEVPRRRPMKKGTLDDDRQNCPGRQMDWPRLEAEGLARPLKWNAVDEQHKPYYALGKDDYGGLFTLTRAQVPRRMSGALSLRAGDSDASKKWSGVTWTETDLAALKSGAALIKELQLDLRTHGYSVDDDGEFDEKTEAAVDHYIWHTFSGHRRNLVTGGSGNRPSKVVTNVVAQHLKAGIAGLKAAAAKP